MRRLRSRMSCRRGSSRGRVSRQPSSITSYPSFEASDFCFDRYPVTRSGCGRGRRQGLTEVHSYHSNAHTACFRIPCTMGNSTFIATVIVELCEDFVGSEAVIPEDPLESMKEDQIESTQNASTQRMVLGGSATLHSTIHAGPSALEAVPSSK